MIYFSIKLFCAQIPGSRYAVNCNFWCMNQAFYLFVCFGLLLLNWRKSTSNAKAIEK